MRSKIEFHTEWAIPEDLEYREDQDEPQDQFPLTAAASAGGSQPVKEKWLVVEA